MPDHASALHQMHGPWGVPGCPVGHPETKKREHSKRKKERARDHPCAGAALNSRQGERGRLRWGLTPQRISVNPTALKVG